MTNHETEDNVQVQLGKTAATIVTPEQPRLNDKEVAATIQPWLPQLRRIRAQESVKNLELPGFGDLSENQIEDCLKEDKNDTGRLEKLERNLMIQLERIDALKRVVQGIQTSDALRSKLESASEELDALFDAQMAEVKKQGRNQEEAAWSWRVFLEEACVPRPLKKNLYVLNAPPDVVTENDRFGDSYFRPIHGLQEVHKHVFGLWVLGTRFSNGAAAAAVGLKARKHTALVVANTDWSRLPPSLRRDEKGVRARMIGQNVKVDYQKDAIQKMPTPVTSEHLETPMSRIFTGQDGLEHVALGFTPVRVRRESRFEAMEDLGDVTVPMSYIFSGKTFFVSMVADQDSIATAVASAQRRHQLGDYVADSSDPWLFSAEGHLDAIRSYPCLAGIISLDMRNHAVSFSHAAGLSTAAGPGLANQITQVLSYEYLRRIMTVMARGIQGMDLAGVPSVEKQLQSDLSNALVGPGKPFNRLSISVDRTSVAGKQLITQGGIQFMIDAQGKYPINQVKVQILPPNIDPNQQGGGVA